MTATPPSRLAALRPDRDDHAHALRVAAALAIPGVVLLLIGRPELLVYAVFGSFAGMYGRMYRGWPRTRQQLRGGLLLCTGIAIGVTLSQVHAPGWLLVVVETAFAVVASLLSDRWRLRPAGPFFAIFALGATALVPASTVRPEVAIALGVATALLAGVIGRLGLRRGSAAAPSSPVPEATAAVLWRHALRYGLAVGTAGGIGLVFGFDHANWAMAAAAVPLAAIDTGGVSATELRSVLRRAGHRIAGTFLGLLITAMILPLDLTPTVMGALIMFLLFPTELYMARHYALAVGFFTPLVMLMTELETPMEPVELLVDRGLDTLIGVAVGVLVAVVVREPGPARPGVIVDEPVVLDLRRREPDPPG